MSTRSVIARASGDCTFSLTDLRRLPFQEWLVTEKWSIMIKMEKTARGKKEKEGMLSRKKKEMRQAVSMRECPQRLRVYACARTCSY